MAEYVMRLMNSGRIVAVLLTLALLHAATALAAEPEITAADMPRNPAAEPRDAIGTFQIKKGFHLELAASEPNIASPVAVSFDEHGRMFVVEMIDYSERRDETPHPGRIRLLEDTDGDGVYDKSTVYADNLAWPTAVFCYDGGIFVGATPDILYLKDVDGDGKADTREVVFTGFAAEVKRINVQAMLNSFNWGLDNRIHGATSGNGGLIKQLRHPDAKPLELHGRDFVIDPRTMTMTSEPGGGQHGLSFDDYGRRFACNNSDHIRLFMYDDRYAARNPFYSMPSPLVSIAVDGPAAEVFRISPEEPWRVIRTRWRIAGLVSGPVEGGGRSAGYFTGATGTTIYRGDAYPPEYRDNAFIGDAGGNLVHRKVLSPDDVGLKAQRGPGEENMEFMASRDTWFRPVQFANAPDGTLFVIDMYRETIEHPWSLPPNIKKFLDLNSGNNRGRIYRIAPDGFKEPAPPRMDKASAAELVATLESPNGWRRDTASRLLYERQEKAAASELVALASGSKSDLGRLHALHALDGLGSLSAATVLKSLDDPHEWVRVHAVRLAESFAGGADAAEIVAHLRKMASDSSNLVRYQLAFTLGEFHEGSNIQALSEIARRDVISPWISAAVLSSLARGSGEVFSRLSSDASFAGAKPGRDFLAELAHMVGAGKAPSEVARVLEFVREAKESTLGFAIARSLGEGLRQSGESLAMVDSSGSLKPIFARAAQLAADDKASESDRLLAIQLLGQTSYATAGNSLLALLDRPEPASIQVGAVEILVRNGDASVLPELIQRWTKYSSRVKSELVSRLLTRADRARALLTAISGGAVDAGDLTSAQAKFLRAHSDPAVKKLAIKVLGEAPANERQSVIDKYQSALSLAGDAKKGREIYQQRCSSCHRIGGEGFALGPDLVTVKNTGKDKMLTNILDPNREVAPAYIAFQIDTRDDESRLGVIMNQSTASVTVRQAYGREEVIQNSKIKSMQSSGQSLMPEGLEQGLTPQDFANLLEFITTADAAK